MSDGDRLTRYLDDLRARLGGLPPGEIDDIAAELRGHVEERLEERGGGLDAIGVILERLGAPEELAALYRADRQLERALDPAASGFSPWRLVAGVARWATVSVAGGFALLLLVAGYWVAVSFCIAAVTRLFAPGRVGLFRLTGGEYSLRLGLLAPPPAGSQELLGFWIVPLGALAGGAVYWVTTRLVRSVAGRWRRRPIGSAGQVRSGGVHAAGAPLLAAGFVASPWFVALELAAVVGFYIADARHLVPFSNTPFLLLLGWLSLRLRGMRWRDVGLVRPPDWRRTIAIGVAAGLAMESFALLVSEPLIARLFGHHPDISDFRFLVGNLKALLLLQLLNWSLAAFGEEMVYRGYLLNRVADCARRLGLGADAAPRTLWVGALIVVSVLFGWAHAEGQGIPGMAQEGWNGFLLGLLYLANGRRLAVPIVAHGVSNTMAFVLIYLGRYPGVS